MSSKSVPFRLDSETLVRLDRIATALAERANGFRPTVAGMFRQALARWLDATERDLGIGGRAAKKATTAKRRVRS
jgi:predicted transcriptional regulator